MYEPNLLCPRDEIYSASSVLYKNGISGKKSATHILLLYTLQYHAMRSTKLRRLFFVHKSFFQVLYSLPVYIILYRRYAINWKKFYFSSQDKGIYEQLALAAVVVQHLWYSASVNINSLLKPFLLGYKK